MPIQITMPRLSDTMEEGTLIKWWVQVGDRIETGDHLADVETDKATMELQAFDDGTVARLVVEEGQSVPVGELILVIAEGGESIDDAAASAGAAEAVPPDVETDNAATADLLSPSGPSTAIATAPPPVPDTTVRVRVSPVARKLAEEHGLDLSIITGSGPDGRIIKRDVIAKVAGAPKSAAAPLALAPVAAQATAPTTLEARTISLSGMRKTIARRLVESATTIPHFTVNVGINMDPLLDLRQTLNTQLEAQGFKLSVNDFIVRATALAAVAHPAANSSWDQDQIIQHGAVNVGVAVALPPERGGGLVVPVLRDVQSKGLRVISAETRSLVQKAREIGLSSQDMADGTITISNLGMYDVDQFTAIINPPQAAILAVGSAVTKPVVRDGELAIGHEMNATLSCDHRVLDGALAAEYLQTLRRLLENPAALLV